MNTFFISDTHFGHNNIIKYCRPQFKHLDEMHEYMIEKWNSVVTPEDKVYHLGDVAFGSKNLHFMSRLRGRKILIAGNHDHYPTDKYLIYFDKVLGASQYKNCILTHIPVSETQLEHRFEMNIHGHLHDQYLNDKRYLNVSVERLDFIPISWEQIQK